MRKTKDFDWEGALLKAGWNTESTASNRVRAFKGSCITPAQSTEWHSHWSLVHDEAMRFDRKEVADESSTT